MPRRFRAPRADGEVMAEPGFDALPALVEANRTRLDRAGVRIGGMSLRELRARAKREAIELAGGSADGPLLVAGHQPELPHPGVWAKHFALNGLARRLGGVPLNLVVDNDTLKSTALRFPAFRDGDPASVHLESLSFDAFAGEVPYEDRAVRDPELFRTFAERAAPLWANWGYEPLLSTCDALRERSTRSIELSSTRGAHAPRSPQHVGEAFTAMRVARERAWGCHNLELHVSTLSQTEAFRRFSAHVLGDLPRFRECYNAAVRAYRAANGVRSANHPAPELADGEAPFWERTGEGRRRRATATSGVSNLRPRALTLTLFARVCLGDFFIHGIGGGKYDEVTDAIIRDYFGVEPPAYQVLSATLHLPLPAFPSTSDDLRAAQRRVRDLRWNAHALPGADAALVAEHARLIGREPPRGRHAERREWFRALQQVKERLRAAVAGEVPGAEAEVERVRREVDANAILRRRDYAWVLYPEAALRPFLEGIQTSASRERERPEASPT